MNTELSPRDWQEISAYLDQMLSPQAKERMEQRLQREPALRSALNDLSSLRNLLRSQPRLRAPRNFTLTPERIGVRQRQSYPILKLAAALASILFIVFVAGDLISQRQAPLAQPLLMESAVQMEAAPAEAPAEPPAMAKIAPPEATSAPAAAAPAAAVDVTPLAAQAPAPMTGFSATPGPETPGVEEPLPAGEAAADLSVQEQARESTMMQTQNIEQARVFGIAQPIWRGFEVLLGFIAIAAGLGWWATRRRA